MLYMYRLFFNQHMTQGIMIQITLLIDFLKKKSALPVTVNCFFTAVLLPLVIVLFCTPLLAHGADEPEIHKIGVLAKRGSDSTLKKWQATAEYLSKTIPGHHFEIAPLAFDQISSAVGTGKIDFLLANPAIFLPLSMHDKLFPLVTLENLRAGKGYSVFGGVIFVRIDSSIRSFRNIEHASFVAVSKKSLGGWLMAWREMAHMGITPAGDIDNVVFAGTQDKVVMAVRDGTYDVGTVRTDTLERMEAEGKIKMADFRVLQLTDSSPADHFPFLRSTRLYPEWPLSATMGTSEKLRKAVAVALLSLQPDSAAARAASITGWDVVHSYQPIHDLYKELRQGPYQEIAYLNYKDVLHKYYNLIVIGALTFIFVMLLLGYLFHLKKRLRADIGRRKNIEAVLKNLNKEYYKELQRTTNNNSWE